MILANRSNTVVFCGIHVLEHGFLRADFAMFFPESPKRLDLYQIPYERGDKLFGTYELLERPITSAVMSKAVLKPYNLESK
jgi:hypothetical protein